MQKFKVDVTKQWKHFTFIVSAVDENGLKERIHKDWYSILSYEKIEESALNQNSWNTFIFEAEKDWEKKQGKVIWEDIFKIYIKLRKNLWYKVIKLFSKKDENISDLEKQKIIKELEEEFFIFNERLNNEKKPNKLEEKKEVNNNSSKNFDNFYLKKELDETYKLIDFILKKLSDIIEEKDIKNIKYEEKEILKNIYNSIIKVKNTTNIFKLKEIWELALLKIWKLEKIELEREKNDISTNLLKETNLLLKKIWSKEQIKEIDYNEVLKSSLWEQVNKIKNFFKKENKIEKEKIDVSSYIYIKNALLLKKYQEKLKINTKEIFINIFKIIFNSVFREDIFLKRSVIKQNILLLKAKNSWIKFSYTKIKNGYNSIIKNLLISFNIIKYFLNYFIVIYMVSFLILLNIYFYIKEFNLPYDIENFNFNWLFYFLITVLLYLILSFSKNIFSIILNFSVLFFITIIWIINF